MSRHPQVRPPRILRRSSKLTAEQVAQIKRLLTDGVRPIELATRFSVSTSNIYAIKSGYTWGWVEPADYVDPDPGGAS